MVKLPFGVDIENLIADLRIISWEASEKLLYYSQILKDTNDKSNILANGNPEDPVTKADLQVNDLIIKRIKEKYQNIPWKILSEENAKLKLNNFDEKSDWRWVLDPLDGTKDFIQGTKNYAMHLALNYKHKPSMGVVLIPEKDQLWIADGQKVWCEKKNGLKIKPNLSKSKILKEMTLVTSKNHGNETLQNLIQKIGFRKVVIMGSIGCKIASIVRGEADIYVCLSLPGKSSPKDWDFAAPEAILRAAGGKITNVDNEDLSYGTYNFAQPGIIIASNDNANHGRICTEIKEIIKEYDLYP